MNSTTEIVTLLTERCGARIDDDDAKPDLFQLWIPSGLDVDVTTRAAVGRYGSAPDGTIVSVILADLRGETDVALLDRNVLVHRSSLPEQLAECVSVMDDAWLVFADLVVDSAVTLDVIELFLKWAGERAPRR